jgi:putative oxidoreductase
MSFIDWVNGICSNFKFLALLLARVIIGYTFITHGWDKFHHLNKVIGFFKSLNIPVPELHAPVVAGLELVCGSLILVGLFTQVASVPLFVILVVAILTAKIGDIRTIGDLFQLSEFLYIALLLWLMTEGAGPISLSGPFRKKGKPKAKSKK